MYWLNGVPRVHAVNGPGIRLPEIDNNDGNTSDNATGMEDVDSHEGSANNANEQEQGAGDTEWAEEPITGLCFSKNGHLFTTMTKSSLAIWQTKVCLCPRVSFKILTET